MSVNRLTSDHNKLISWRPSIISVILVRSGFPFSYKASLDCSIIYIYILLLGAPKNKHKCDMFNYKNVLQDDITNTYQYSIDVFS